MDLHEAKAFYLEFGVEDYPCQQLFILKDNGELSARNRRYFSRSQPSIICAVTDNRAELRFFPVQQHSFARQHPYKGWLFGLRLHQSCPDLSTHLSLEQRRAIAMTCRLATKDAQAKQLLASLHDLMTAICASPANKQAPQSHIKSQYSERTLRRRSISNTGLSPKKLADVQRDSNAMYSLINEEQSISAAAVSQGYSDQSHFSRRFQNFSGSSPARFRKRWKNDSAVHFIQESSSLPNLTFGMIIQ